jgi:integrase
LHCGGFSIPIVGVTQRHPHMEIVMTQRNLNRTLISGQLDETLQPPDFNQSQSRIESAEPLGPSTKKHSVNGRRHRPSARDRKGRRSRGLHLIRIGRFLHIRGSHRKTRVRKSTGQSDLQIAEQLLANERRAIDNRLDLERLVLLAPERLSSQPVLLPQDPSLEGALVQPVAAVGKKADRHCAPQTCAPKDPTRPPPVPEGTVRTFCEACDHYLMYRPHSEVQVKIVEKLRAIIGPDTACREVNDDLLQWLRKKLLRDSSGIQSYKRSIVGPVKSIMRHASAVWGDSQGCPAPNFLMIPEAKGRTVTLLPTHAEKLISLAGRLGYRLLADILPIGLCEGLRGSELFNLMWEDIDEDHRLVTLRNTKSKHHEQRQRIIGSPRPRTWAVFAAMKARQNGWTGPVFVDPTRRSFDKNGRGFASPATMGSMLNAQLKELGETLKLPDPITLHVLRHSAASYHYLVEPDFVRVQKRMDWKNIKSTARYVHEMDLSLRGAVQSFWDPVQ